MSLEDFAEWFYEKIWVLLFLIFVLFAVLMLLRFLGCNIGGDSLNKGCTGINLQISKKNSERK